MRPDAISSQDRIEVCSDQMLTRNGVNNARFKSDANQIHSQMGFKDPDGSQMLSDYVNWMLYGNGNYS